ncbi:MAG: hypothetical protein ACRD2T_12060 [Thermoanaerobaculia bacterium]
MTDEGRKLPELHESATGTAAHRQVVPGPEIAAALEREAREARKKARTREAPARGR